jgi:hypothetical protein
MEISATAAWRQILTGSELPAGLTVRGNLWLTGRPALTALPAGLTVRGSLALTDCAALTALPDGLTVGGDLDLTDCPALAALPPGLRVGGSLYLTRCAGLDHLCVGTDARGYRFYRVKMRDGVHVVAGCRNFSAAQARAHWAEGTECRALAEKCLKGEDGQ